MTDERLDKDLKKMQDAIHQGALFVVGNSKDITALQEWQIRQNGTLVEIKDCLKEIADNQIALKSEDIANLRLEIVTLKSDDIADLRLEMAKGKPTWATLIIITFLSSITVGAVVFAIRVAALVP